jgi:acetyltransferase-like isoleucine patch superfamily enzyme
MRRTNRYTSKGPNSLWNVFQTVSFWKVLKNVIVIQLCMFIPFFRMKNFFYRNFLGIKIEKNVSFAFKVVPDILFPEKIHVGENSIIGYNTTLLAHEYLINEYRIGDIVIGKNVMIGANTTVLPGVHIGDGAVISAATLVHRDVPKGAFVGGNPMQIIRTVDNPQTNQE